MLLTSVTNLKLDKIDYEIVDASSQIVKEVYNFCLLKLENTYKNENKFLSQSELYKLVRNETNYFNYLPSQVIQQTIRKLYQNFKSFFQLLKKKRNNQYEKRISKPKFIKHNKEIIFQKDSFRIKGDFIYLSIGKYFKDKFNKNFLKVKLPYYLKNYQIKYIEIVSKIDYYSLHIVYEAQENSIINEFDKWLSIDIGLNNLLTCTSNITKAFIINGKPLKSINQKYNKKIAKLKSLTEKLNKRKTTKQIRQLYNKRGFKINSEIHKITDFIVKVVKEKGLNKVIIGYNKEWKQNLSLGKRINQNFTQISFYKIIQQLQYKFLLEGIELIIVEESYTSKTSALDLEKVSKHQTYKGKRINRGLFRTSKGILINADVNGSLNIFRKAIKNLSKKLQEMLFDINEIIKLIFNPIKITLKTDTSKQEVFSYISSL